MNRVSEEEFGQQNKRHWSEGTMAFSENSVNSRILIIANLSFFPL